MLIYAIKHGYGDAAHKRELERELAQLDEQSIEITLSPTMSVVTKASNLAQYVALYGETLQWRYV
jgi:hypothetical protein